MFILLQISNAMRYLEQLNVTHRDLAVRNCLVYDRPNETSDARNLNLKNIFIKITDIAICLPEYRKEYHLHGNSKLLPIRYMPAEALFEGLYSSSSDTWSFGILIWQLFTNCKYTPFFEWSNNDFLYNLKLYMYSFVLTLGSNFKNASSNHTFTTPTTSSLNKNIKMLNFPVTQFSSLKGQQKISQQLKINSTIKNYNNDLNHPFDPVDKHNKVNDLFIKCCLNMPSQLNCTKEIYDLLIECCNMNMVKRPKFKDIYLFLHCKIFGSKL